VVADIACEVNDLDERLKDLMQELGNAINESLSESERIASAIGEIRGAGYDVFLVLEATIGFNKRDDDADPDESGSLDITTKPSIEGAMLGAAAKVTWSPADEKFLKSLKIAVDEESGT
jgi:hypothetical protein